MVQKIRETNAYRMLQNGIEVETVSKETGLSVEKVEKIKKTL